MTNAATGSYDNSFFHVLMCKCSLSFTKLVQMSAMKVYSQIAECSPTSTKLVQMSAMKVYSQIAECSPTSTKVLLSLGLTKLSCEKNCIKSTFSYELKLNVVILIQYYCILEIIMLKSKIYLILGIVL